MTVKVLHVEAPKSAPHLSRGAAAVLLAILRNADRRGKASSAEADTSTALQERKAS
jgi:hypothetical protein